MGIPFEAVRANNWKHNANIAFSNRQRRNFRTLFGNTCPNAPKEKWEEMFGWVNKPLLETFSDELKIHSDVVSLANLGFKYALPLTRRRAASCTRFEVEKILPEAKLKVGRILAHSGFTRSVNSCLRSPPANYVPNVDWDKFPAERDFFHNLEKAVQEEPKRVFLASSAYFTESATLENKVTATISTVLNSGHFFCMADKDPTMIIIKKDWYSAAVDKLLSTLQVQQIDLPAGRVVSLCRKFMVDVVNHITSHSLTPKVVEDWLVTGCDLVTMPKLKLLFKTHKERSKWWLGGKIPPARPIVTQFSWLTKNCSFVLTKFLGEVLQLVRNDHPVLLLKNSFELVRHFERNGMIGHNFFCVTGDIDSLYSNIPCDLVQKSCSFFCKTFSAKLQTKWAFMFCNGLFCAPAWLPDFLPYSNFHVSTVLDTLLLLVLALNVFVAPGGKVYSQTSGIAMGLGVAPILADLALAYLEHLNSRVFRKYLVARYLDDVLIISNVDDIDKKAVTAAYSPLSISWAAGSSFLDLRIEFNPGLEIGVFFKEANRAAYLPFKSNHPLPQKLSWLRGEVIRYIRICSTGENFDLAKARLILAAYARGYPVHILKRQIGSVLWSDRDFFLEIRKKEEDDPKVAICLAFCPHRTSDLPKSNHVRIVWQSGKTVRQLLGLQNKTMYANPR